MSTSHTKLLESSQPVCVIYGKDANANYPVLRLDYATLATGGTGFIVWWDGGFNNDSAKCYVVDIEMDPFAAIDRVLPICSHVVITSAAHDAIEYRGELGRLEAMQAKAFDTDNPGVDESAATFGVHGYVVWGHNTNLEIPGCVVDFDGRYECFYRGNTINANAKQMLLAYNDDPIALLRAARRRHSYVIITLRAMSRMQSAGHDLSSIRESTNPSEKRGVDYVREAAGIIRSGVGNVAGARNTLSRYGFTDTCLAEITVRSSTQQLLDRIDRLCEISTGALVWASKNRDEFPENRIGGTKGKYKARKVGQYGAKSLVNERSEDQSDDEIYDECRAYCRNASDRQLPNIYSDEKERGRRGGEVGRVAKIFARAAKDEMEERGLEESYTNENDAKSEYTAHANKLLKSSLAAVEDADSRHGRAFGLGYRAYLKTILRGDDPTHTKPKGDNLAGWNQARHDLAALDPMSEARRGPERFTNGSINEVAGYTLRDSDKKAVDAWVRQQAKDGGWVTNDGTTLSTTGMGSTIHAKWINNRPFIGPAYGNVTQTLTNYIRRALKRQGMTTIGRLDAKGNAMSESAYRSLNDAATIVPELSEGTTEVWFAKSGAGKPRAGALSETHVRVGNVRCNSHERLFVLLQEDKWSPKGEANAMLESMGLKHRSLSVGDVLVINGRARVVSDHGFDRLES